MANFENKPIALMTGLPGSGKTALIVKFMQEAAAEGRPIFQTGIADLKIPHIPMPPMDTWTEMREDPDLAGVMCPFFTFPERSLVVLSEAQRIYRPRPSGSKVPDLVAAFETCRHTGVTFIFDTQHPDFIDTHCRKLVGQHIHLLDHGVLGRWHYEWPYAGVIDRFKDAPIKKKYSLPKQVFGLYKSSSLHIKRNYSIPPAVIALVVLISILIGGGWWFFNYRLNPTPPKSEAVSAVALPGSAPVAPLVSSTDPADILMEFSPRVPGRPETAPVFDSLRQVKNMPLVVGCYKTAKSCTCQNQQGLDAGLDKLQCEQWIHAPRFDAYRDDPQPKPSNPSPSPQQQPATQPEAMPQAPAPSPAPVLTPSTVFG